MKSDSSLARAFRPIHLHHTTTREATGPFKAEKKHITKDSNIHGWSGEGHMSLLLLIKHGLRRQEWVLT